MKISSRGRYAIDLMVDIAINGDSGPISIKDIAKRKKLSIKYLEQIVSSLQKAGLVTSIRGAQGGYQLNRKAEEYAVGDILRVTEGNLAPVECFEDENFSCTCRDSCKTMKMWAQLSQAINDVVDNISLADLVEWNSK